MNFIRYACGLAGLLLAAPAAAQTTPPADTTRLRYAEEAAPTAAAAPAPHQLQQAQRGRWKLGVNNFLPTAYPFSGAYRDTYYTRYGVHLAYERWLGRAWSVQAEVSPARTHYRRPGEAAIRAGLSGRAQLAGRYYYNLERRLRLGRYVGNFSANYLSLALGTGLGGPVRETPFYLVANGLGSMADAALLYGVQRHLGRHGYLDVSVGVAGLLAGGVVQQVSLATSLRVGLALPTATYAAPPVPPDEAQSLQPRAYVGAQVGAYFYRVHYASSYPYPAAKVLLSPTEWQTTEYPRADANNYGNGDYTDYITPWPLPYVYAGYYLTPRLAVQLGAQYVAARQPIYGTAVSNATGQFLVQNTLYTRRLLALPALLRYRLTPSFRARWQVDALGGLTPLWSSAEFQEFRIADYKVTDQQEFGFIRRDFGWHASLGLSTSYAFGRRRQVQASVESIFTKDLRTAFQSQQPLVPGISLGLRYRFAYR